MNTKKTILLVEDDEVDIIAIKRAFGDLHIKNQLDVVNNGEEALAYLKEKNKAPLMILLDLNMPKMNGIEFLRVIKEEKISTDVPVVILTTSQAEKDKINGLNMNVEGYIVKPIGYEEFVEMMRTVMIDLGFCEAIKK